jgi:hypothetical protein
VHTSSRDEKSFESHQRGSELFEARASLVVAEGDYVILNGDLPDVGFLSNSLASRHHSAERRNSDGAVGFIEDEVSKEQSKSRKLMFGNHFPVVQG